MTTTDVPEALFNANSLQRIVVMAEHAKSVTEHLNTAVDQARQLVALWDEMNGDSKRRAGLVPEAVALPRFVKNGSSPKTKVYPTMKRNCDLAYQIFLECKTPLHKDDLLKRMRATGKTNLTKASSLAYYIRLDERFEKAGHGLWYIKKSESLLQ